MDLSGNPILEQFNLENNGNVIDENGTWLVDLPMNLDYLVTNEFGETVISNDPSLGVPTKGKYRFKIKWDQPGQQFGNVLRANYLVPNIREHWTSSSSRPLNMDSSYAFSLDWSDYAIAILQLLVKILFTNFHTIKFIQFHHTLIDLSLVQTEVDTWYKRNK